QTRERHAVELAAQRRVERDTGAGRNELQSTFGDGDGRGSAGRLVERGARFEGSDADTGFAAGRSCWFHGWLRSRDGRRSSIPGTYLRRWAPCVPAHEQGR